MACLRGECGDVDGARSTTSRDAQARPDVCTTKRRCTESQHLSSVHQHVHFYAQSLQLKSRSLHIQLTFRTPQPRSISEINIPLPPNPKIKFLGNRIHALFLIKKNKPYPNKCNYYGSDFIRDFRKPKYYWIKKRKFDKSIEQFLIINGNTIRKQSFIFT